MVIKIKKFTQFLMPEFLIMGIVLLAVLIPLIKYIINIFTH